jgi:hypothetical protein
MTFYDWAKDTVAGAEKQLANLDPWHRELKSDASQAKVMYGVTNRPVTADGKSLVDKKWAPAISPTVSYFREDVEIAGKPGSFTFQSNTKPEIISKDEFDKGVSDEVKASGGKLGIFIHGIRTASGEAGATGALLAGETGEPFVIEDWASTKASTLIAAHQEKGDDDASFKSQGMIDANVDELVQKYGASNIDMVAHSRGSMNQIRALANIQANKLGAVHSATFAHSDVDVSDFQLALPSFENAAKRLDIIYNPEDTALRLSELQRFGQVAKLDDAGGAIEESARLGRVGLTPGVGIDSYVASPVPNYFTISKDTINDTIGHAFAPSLVASMISSPQNYTQFSRLKTVSTLAHNNCPFSAISGLKNVVSAIPRIPLHLLSAAKASMDIVSNSPEVQRYISNDGLDYAALSGAML